MKLKILHDMNYSTATLKEGTVVEVEKVTSSSFVFNADRRLYKAPLGYYYGHGYSSSRYFEAVD